MTVYIDCLLYVTVLACYLHCHFPRDACRRLVKEQCVGQWILVILRHLFDCKDVEVLDLCLLLHILYTWDLIIFISNDYYEPVEQGTDSKANYTCKMLK